MHALPLILISDCSDEPGMPPGVPCVPYEQLKFGGLRPVI